MTTPLFQLCYRLLLLALPGEFRRRFGADMLRLALECGEPRLALIGDLLACAARERWDGLRAEASLPRLCSSALTAGLAGSLLIVSQRHVLDLGSPGPALPNVLGGLLPALTDPTMAFVLVVAGLYGLITEFSAPGSWLAGSLGVASLAAGLLSLAAMPVNRLGLALLLASVTLFLAGVKLPLHGLLADAGLLAFVGGSLTLFNFGDSGLSISEPVVLASAAATFLLFGVVARCGARARKLPPLSPDDVLGRAGRALASGQVLVRGERWAARCEEALPAGSPVEVVAVRGLTLTVRPVRAV